MNVIQCAHCAALNPETAQFCGACGSPVAAGGQPTVVGSVPDRPAAPDPWLPAAPDPHLTTPPAAGTPRASQGMPTAPVPAVPTISRAQAASDRMAEALRWRTDSLLTSV